MKKVSLSDNEMREQIKKTQSYISEITEIQAPGR